MARRVYMKVVFWGGTAKAMILHEILQDQGVAVATIFDYRLDTPEFETSAHFINRATDFAVAVSQHTHFVVCIGGERGYARCATSDFLIKHFQLKPIGVRHTRAFAETSARLGEGVQILAGSIVCHKVILGDYSVLNTNAHVDHECEIGKGVHVMGGAAVAGRVRIGDYASVGTNATIMPNLSIGEGAVVGAGAVVTRDVEDYSVVIGSPAKEVRKAETRFSRDILEAILKEKDDAR